MGAPAVSTSERPGWAIWISVHGRASLHLFADDPRRSIDWKGYWEPKAIASPFQLTDAERAMTIAEIEARHPAPAVIAEDATL